ncbi:Kelch-like protein 28 [Anabarilius grahami]|uniref:Kelch-like protein 28 n=1 Tax=Anabarilius grahami TaxID=495550 RepID=A0A3N0YZQ7_ANAGA|nr:Kelch-like protein 28 [Anabarilius grahami]
MALVWAGSMIASQIVFIPGIVVGKYGKNILPAFWRNAAFLVLPIWAAAKLFNRPRELPIIPADKVEVEQKKALFSRPADLLLTLGLLGTIIFTGFRGFVILECSLDSCFSYIYQYEPYMKDSVGFPKVMMLVSLFYVVPLLTACVYGLYTPGCTWMLDWTLFLAGAVAQRYDPSKDSWDMVAPMADKRINFGVGVMLGFIFVVGGHNGVSHLSSIERYDPHQNQWTACRPMNEPRTGVGSAVVDNYLYVVGGHSGSSYLNTVQRYDPITDSWHDSSGMMYCRSHSCISPQTQWTHLGASVHSRTSFTYRIPRDEWRLVVTLNLLYAAVPVLLAVRCYMDQAFFMKNVPQEQASNGKKKS